MNRKIRCKVHGTVDGPFCVACRTLRYLEKVESGEINPKPLEFIELEKPTKELSYMQIRFRAYRLRLQREERRDVSGEVWKNRPRDVRTFSTRFFRG